MDCSCSFVVDIDVLPTEFDEAHVKAFEDRVCCECGEVIRAGQLHERATGLWDDEWAGYNTCLPCARIRADLCRGQFNYGELIEIFDHCYGFDYRKIPEDEDE